MPERSCVHAHTVEAPTGQTCRRLWPLAGTVLVVLGTSDKAFHVFPASVVRTKYVLDAQPVSTRAQLEIPATAVAAVGLVRLMAVIGGRPEDLTVLQLRPSFPDS